MQITRLTDEYANTLFCKLFGSSGIDNALLGLFRAIVLDKGGEIEDATVQSMGAYDCGDIETVLQGGAAFTVVRFRGGMDNLSSFIERHPEWKGFNEGPFFIDKYLSQWIKTTILINEETKRTVVIVDRSTSELWYRALCSSLFKILTWYYPSPTKEDVALFRSISINKSNTTGMAEQAIVDYINSVCDKCDWEVRRLHSMLDDYSKRTFEQRISEANSLLRNTNTDIERYIDVLKDLYERAERCRLDIAALEALGDKADETWFNFFSARKNYVDVLSVNGSNIKYQVVGDLEFYDDFKLEQAYDARENESGVLRYICKDLVESVVKRLLLERRGRIRQVGVFELMGGRHVQSLADEWYRKDCMPNQHIYKYGCDGENGPRYAQCAESGDWELGIDQSVQAVKNLNTGDGTVLGNTISWFGNNENKKIKCIWVTDGSPLGDGRLPEGAHLVDYNEFCELVAKKLGEETGNE